MGLFCPSAMPESQTSFGVTSAFATRPGLQQLGKEGKGLEIEHLPSEGLQNRILFYNLIEIISTQSSTVCWLHSKQNMLPAVRDNYYLLTGF